MGDIEFSHISVLAGPGLEARNVRPDGAYIDATTGGGGHSLLIAERLGPGGRLFCFDRDQEALDAARKRLAGHLEKVVFIQSNFARMAQALAELSAPRPDGILFDLGVSSYQLDNSCRGFSYKTDAPLDMRMDRGQALTAREVVNKYSQQRLRQLLWEYGEERYSGRVAAAIVRRREERPIETTLELAEIIRGALPPQALREKQHPAKRSFQAIRIEVNGELQAVEQALNDGLGLLNPGGRAAVISFHSLEDRIVKRVFAQQAKGCVCPPEFPVCVCGRKPQIKLLHKGVILPDKEEMEQNPRARSAKLRAAEKL